jgi:hypothetical protein
MDYLPAVVDQTDPTRKVQFWYKRLTDHTVEIYQPGEIIAVDEGMTTGRSPRNPIKQNMVHKPIKWGPKSWEGTDQHGVTMYVKLYRGKKPAEASEKGLAQHVIEDVLHLLTRKQLFGHIIVADNFFGSFGAIEACRLAGQKAVFMMRQPNARAKPETRRHSPFHALLNALPKNAKRGSSIAYYFEAKMMALAWKDKKNIFFLSSATNESGHAPVCFRNKRGVGREVIASTNTTEFYNKWKSLVDQLNNTRHISDITTRFHRWWLRTFINGPIVIAASNGWRFLKLLNSAIGRKSCTWVEYQIELAIWLKNRFVASSPHPPLPPPPKFGVTLVPYTGGHKLVPAISVERPRCKVCSGGGHCGFMCSLCNITMHEKCFFIHCQKK